MEIKEYKAKILRSNKREFECKVEETLDVVTAVCLREVIKKEHPVVGDNVLIRPLSSDNRYEIFELCKRKNEIFRKIVRSNKKKVISANTDLILIVVASSKPDYKPFLIDRYLARAEQWNIPAVVIINKMDEFEGQFDLEMECKKFKQLEVPHYLTSSTNHNEKKFKTSLEDLKQLLHGKTAITLGQSGVGKSKLISALSGGSVELLSSRLAKGIKKGAHTTTWAEIVDCNNFFIVDSPGVRSMAVIDLSPDELPGYFPDLVPYFEGCQFFDCRHEENSKGCAFLELDLKKDTDLITMNRLISFLRMRDEIESIPEWKK